MNGIQLLRPAWLLVLPVMAWLWWRLRQSRDPLRGWRAQMDAPLLEALRVGETRLPRSELLPLVAGLLAVIALAGPVFRLAPSPFAEDEAVLVIVLHCGDTMEEPPPEPSSLVQAQEKIRDVITERADGTTALIAYAGSAHMVLPATTDGTVIADLAREVSPGIMPVQGDNLSDALTLAGSLLEDATGGSVLVLTDQVESGPDAVANAWESAGRPPVQFLSLRDPVDPGLTAVARRINAPVQAWTPDAQDVQAVVRRASRQVRSAAAGEGEQWQEDGWWLLPALAVIVVLGFRREEAE